ncbi:NAD-dependent succinate-semialdehyde dehydrogenase [Gulosibacter chungangensis]|uniref:NAD-dependent succinate-semialdehyde dehydrogenase n=1 Tax=Gulosibacter chungangensis TaxID=979746 RepID=A0A7J5B7S0_9MICO|nr:NAD-dependent succinate-semialdehyde dehydrogenase [Gulosibacter chungangensis]KAB1641173.1 NAD-dependent succinate-semialdehyde dehydrogenase [Gulosibacter chungangensis]
MTFPNEADLIAKIPTQLFIGGEWVDGENEPFAVLDPSTGKVLTHVANATPAQGTAALDAAVAVKESWARTPARERSEILRKAFERVIELRDEFALLMTIEMGKPLPEAQGEVNYGAEFLRWFAEEGPRVIGRYGATPEGNARMLVSKHPVGPCFLITPWNFPLAMATRKIGPALAAGNTVVVKPASLTPLTTLYLVKVFEEVGLPKGVINVITTRDTAGVSNVIMEDDRLRKVSFTGSTPVGVNLMKQAAEKVLRTSMELGGNAPFVVFEDADLDKAVDGVIAAKFRNIGQACTAANRIYVQKSIADEFSKRVAERVGSFKMGRGTEDGVIIGPLVEEKAVNKVAEMVEDAKSKGAEVVIGGNRGTGEGFFFEATVLNNVSLDSQVVTDEIFGPVLPIVQFEDEAEAVKLANSSEYGLMSYVFTEDFNRGQRMIDAIESGMMGLNIGVLSNAAAPFGGVKMSGVGKEGSFEGIEEYLYTKYTAVPDPYAGQ